MAKQAPTNKIPQFEYACEGRTHTYTFPDAPIDNVSITIADAEYDQFKRLMGTVTARMGEIVANPARFDVLNQKERVNFHSVAATLDGQIDWHTYLLVAVPHLLKHLAYGPDLTQVFIPQTPEPECPALPYMEDEDPERVAELAALGSPWLDGYITVSRTWAPRAYDDYHEACGLFVLSTIAARRIRIEFGADGVYPSLYQALTGRTSLWTKSTTVAIALGLLGQAGLTALLAPDESTPQAFLSSMVARVPDGYETMTADQLTQATMRLTFAAQRGWFYEEFGQHLSAMMQRDGHMAAFRGILRRLDDHKETFSTGTISRGLETLEKPYLSLLANLTPADIHPFARAKSSLWSDGYFARFAFITAPLFGHSDAPYPKGRITYPADLLIPLRAWHESLRTPTVRIDPVLDAKLHETGDYTLHKDPLPETHYHLSYGVWNSYYRYDTALRHLISQAATQDLDGSYARFPIKALRIAGLLASLEDEPTRTIQLRHWYRGRTIAERWRASLHRLVAQLQDDLPGESREQTVEQLIERALRRSGSLSIRELKQKTHATYAEINRAMEMMLKVGVAAVDETQSGRTTRYGLIVQTEEP